MPFLPSIDSIATRIRICGVIWIRTQPPTTPGSRLQDPMRKHPLTGFVPCHVALPVQSCIPEQRLPEESEVPRTLGLTFQKLFWLHQPFQFAAVEVEFGRSTVDTILVRQFG